MVMMMCNRPSFFFATSGRGAAPCLGTASPPGQKWTRKDGVIRPQLSDNSVVGHTRINRVDRHEEEGVPSPDLLLTSDSEWNSHTPAQKESERKFADQVREGEWHSP
jgi:hypothetical protein